ncbi:hypothetical protein ACRALDRAFT_1079882 [Sodiomyces alcalophilus JCM 7366]|uniref:uncharacterized protein n=1 Tax=Sodiomyces alcalophilus JCM 7366 TaxID=591952 RepID=UPI0039B68184
MAAAAPSNDSNGSFPSPPSESPQDGSEPFPPLSRASTVPATFHGAGPHFPSGNAVLEASPGPTATLPHRQDRSHLAPEDAIFASPPRHHDEEQQQQHRGLYSHFDVNPADAGLLSADDSLNRPRRHARSRGRHQHRHGGKRRWKKLLWVKQSYPDNYTDQATFLENLQRNPRLKPYDFWPLVADSTVIVQHVCSVIIFVVCFVGIFQERVSPVAVVSWSSLAHMDSAAAAATAAAATAAAATAAAAAAGTSSSISTNGSSDIGGSVATMGTESSGTKSTIHRPVPLPLPSHASPQVPSAGLSAAPPSAASSATDLSSNSSARYSHSAATATTAATSTATAKTTFVHSTASATSPTPSHPSRASQDTADPRPPTLAPSPLPPNPRRLRAYSYSVPPRSHPATSRTHERLGTLKSAILIWSTLLGLSPILKSLTRSTSSDSIWAMSFWLLAVNIFSFDYSTAGSASARVPASLSTNAALMASTVLASRLPSTGQVFSLTLFSIEVFGLFPVFRRYARSRSWSYHYAMTALLVLGAGAGVGIILGDHSGTGPGPLFPWKNALVGMIVGALASALAMGGCSWWLIGLQKYKNEIYGPWDPARPIIMSRRQWD